MQDVLRWRRGDLIRLLNELQPPEEGVYMLLSIYELRPGKQDAVIPLGWLGGKIRELYFLVLRVTYSDASLWCSAGLVSRGIGGLPFVTTDCVRPGAVSVRKTGEMEEKEDEINEEEEERESYH